MLVLCHATRPTCRVVDCARPNGLDGCPLTKPAYQHLMHSDSTAQQTTHATTHKHTHIHNHTYTHDRARRTRHMRPLCVTSATVQLALVAATKTKSASEHQHICKATTTRIAPQTTNNRGPRNTIQVRRVSKATPRRCCVPPGGVYLVIKGLYLITPALYLIVFANF